MKKKELKNEVNALSKEEMKAKSRTIAEELMKLRFRAKTGRLEKGHLIRELRRQRARVLTRLRAEIAG